MVMIITPYLVVVELTPLLTLTIMSIQLPGLIREGSYTFSVTNTLEHKAATINEAGYIPSNVDIYAIGFDISAGSTAEDVLKGCADSGKYYLAGSGGLSAVFNEVGSEIKYAAQDVTVVDPMSEYANLKLADPSNPTWKLASDSGTADVVVTKGSVQFVPVGSKWKIIWTISAISEQYEADGVTPKGEKMTYTVLVDPTTTESGHLYPANKDTTVDYTEREWSARHKDSVRKLGSG